MQKKFTNYYRRGQAETDPIKKSRIANFLKEYWGIERGANQHDRVVNNSPSSKEITNYHWLLKKEKPM